MFGRIGWTEILIIVVLVLILFGSAKIPNMMKNIADGINVFKKELKDTKKAKNSSAAADVKSATITEKPVAKKRNVKKAVQKKSGPAKKKAATPKNKAVDAK